VARERAGETEVVLHKGASRVTPVHSPAAAAAASHEVRAVLRTWSLEKVRRRLKARDDVVGLVGSAPFRPAAQEPKPPRMSIGPTFGRGVPAPTPARLQLVERALPSSEAPLRRARAARPPDAASRPVRQNSALIFLALTIQQAMRSLVRTTTSGRRWATTGIGVSSITAPDSHSTARNAGQHAQHLVEQVGPEQRGVA
jgi:hypothetical protein